MPNNECLRLFVAETREKNPLNFSEIRSLATSLLDRCPIHTFCLEGLPPNWVLSTGPFHPSVQCLPKSEVPVPSVGVTLSFVWTVSTSSSPRASPLLPPCPLTFYSCSRYDQGLPTGQCPRFIRLRR